MYWGEIWTREEEEEARSSGDRLTMWHLAVLAALVKAGRLLNPRSPPPPPRIPHLGRPRLASRRGLSPSQRSGTCPAPSRCKHQNSRRFSPSHGPASTPPPHHRDTPPLPQDDLLLGVWIGTRAALASFSQSKFSGPVPTTTWKCQLNLFEHKVKSGKEMFLLGNNGAPRAFFTSLSPAVFV